MNAPDPRSAFDRLLDALPSERRTHVLRLTARMIAHERVATPHGPATIVTMNIPSGTIDVYLCDQGRPATLSLWSVHPSSQHSNASHSNHSKE